LMSLKRRIVDLRPFSLQPFLHGRNTSVWIYRKKVTLPSREWND
jgi:hypothetical protein